MRRTGRWEVPSAVVVALPIDYRLITQPLFALLQIGCMANDPVESVAF